jgi:hypothetical protein
MILSVHATFGAAVASMMPGHPVLGFTLGFASHFILDAIPHKDYKLISTGPDANKKPEAVDLIREKFSLIRDMIFVSFDAFVGLCLAFLFFFNPAHPAIFLIGAVSALIPDFLTFLYLLLKHKPLGKFFNFHVGLVHSKIVFNLNQALGVLLQFCTLGVLIGILYVVKSFIS